MENSSFVLLKLHLDNKTILEALFHCSQKKRGRHILILYSRSEILLCGGYILEILSHKKQQQIPWPITKYKMPKTLRGPVHTGSGAPGNRRTQIMEHIVVNGRVYAADKQHQSVCMQICAQICLRILCERGLRVRRSRNTIVATELFVDKARTFSRALSPATWSPCLLFRKALDPQRAALGIGVVVSIRQFVSLSWKAAYRPASRMWLKGRRPERRKSRVQKDSVHSCNKEHPRTETHVQTGYKHQFPDYTRPKSFAELHRILTPSLQPGFLFPLQTRTLASLCLGDLVTKAGTRGFYRGSEAVLQLLMGLLRTYIPICTTKVSSVFRSGVIPVTSSPTRPNSQLSTPALVCFAYWQHEPWSFQGPHVWNNLTNPGMEFWNLCKRKPNKCEGFWESIPLVLHTNWVTHPLAS